MALKLDWRDIRRHDAIVRDFYRGVQSRGLVTAAAGAIKAIVPGEITGATLSRRRVPVEIFFDPMSAVLDVSEAEMAVMAGHPTLFQRFRDARSISDAMSRRRWDRTALSVLMRDLYRVEDDLGMDVRLGRGVELSVCASRSWGRFSDRDRAMMTLLRPHFEAARRLEGAQAATERFLRGEWSGVEVVTLDLSGRVLAWSAGARELVARCFGRTPNQLRGLPEELTVWILRQKVGGELAATRAALVRQDKGCRVVFYFLHDEALGRQFLVARSEGVRAPIASAPELSARELDVARGAVAGLRNAEIAARLNVAGATVKRHLENIYAKLGVRGRGELAARLGEAASPASF